MPTQIGANAFVSESIGSTPMTWKSGQQTTVAASDTVVTGLTRVVFAMAQLEDAPVIGCDRAGAAIGNQAGTPAAGSILVKTFKPTASGDSTPIAATTFGKRVNWIAAGY